MPLPEWRFEAIGTRWSIETPVALTPDDRVAVSDLIARVDLTWSRFRTDGGVARLQRGDEVDLGPGADDLLDLYDRLHVLTAGAMNPLVGGALATLGYDAELSLTRHGDPAAAPEWSDVRRRRPNHLQIPPGAVLDVGAAGKGWLVDRVADLLVERGHAPTVEAGGDLAHRGPEPIRVALEHPADASHAVGVVELEPHHALCGSAINRRVWADGLHHVLDARTGRPTTGVVATWALAPTAAAADGCATALFFVGPERLGDLAESTVTIDGAGVHASATFPGEVFA